MTQRSYGKLRSALRRSDGVRRLSQQGMSEPEIRRFARTYVRPFFRNPKNLFDFDTGLLVNLLDRLLVFRRNTRLQPQYEHCLDIYRSAEALSPQASMVVCEQSQLAMRAGETTLWSDGALAVPTHGLSLEDLALHEFRTVGGMLESIIKLYLQELLCQVEIGGGQPNPKSEVDTRSLGAVVNELLDKTSLSDLLRPPPWGVRLNQWRNIAQHYLWEVKKATIICSYGTPPRIRTVAISKDELSQLYSTTVDVMHCLVAARTVFLLDRPTPALEIAYGGSLRDEAVVADFVRGASAYGLDVTEFSIDDESAEAVIRDLKEDDAGLRKRFALGTAYALWVFFGRARVMVEYQDSNGTPRLSVTLTDDQCVRIREEGLDSLMDPHELPQIVHWHGNQNPIGSETASCGNE